MSDLVSKQDLLKRIPELDTVPEWTRKLFEAFIEAAPVIETDDKYRWHDLRENPRDLPDNGWDECTYAVLSKETKRADGSAVIVYCHGSKKCVRSLIKSGDKTVIGWKELEPLPAE